METVPIHCFPHAIHFMVDCVSEGPPHLLTGALSSSSRRVRLLSCPSPDRVAELDMLQCRNTATSRCRWPACLSFWASVSWAAKQRAACPPYPHTAQQIQIDKTMSVTEPWDISTATAAAVRGHRSPGPATCCEAHERPTCSNLPTHGQQLS